MPSPSRPRPCSLAVLAWACTCALALPLRAAAAPAEASGPDDAASTPTSAPRATRAHDRRGLAIPSTRFDDAAIEIDGVPNEDAWAPVPLLPELVQRAPVFGGAPSKRTEVRVAYGERGLYFAFVCHQDPESVIAPFFQRDQLVPSDLVVVEIDSNGDDTNGYVFGVSPSGAIFDGQLFRDTNQELLWDGVFQAAGSKSPVGWTAEIFVPWATLRFERQDANTIGVNVQRSINEGDEVDRLSFVPQGVPARVSEAIDWTNITGIDAGLNLELQPYTSGRFALQRPPDSLDQSWRALPNAGFDLKYGITGDLTLDLAVNPDFGQAEVDAAVLNLGPFEVFFPEKRRFFLESKEIFETGFALFYSRRVGAAPSPGAASPTSRVVFGEEEQASLVGLDPISRVLGSARLTGQVAPGWIVGALSAVTGPTWGVQRFSDGSEQRVPADPLTSWNVARVRKHFDPQTWIGGIVTNVTRASPDHPGATTGGIDYNINFRQRWTHGAQVIATHDGEKSGMGGQTSLVRSGRRTRWNLNSEFLTPHANFSDMGFMTRNNYVSAATGLSVFNAQPIGQVRQLSGRAEVIVGTSFQGELTRKQLFTDWSLETLGLWRITAFAGGHLPQYNLFETRGNIPWEVPLHWWSGFRVSTPRNKRVSGSLGGAYGEQDGNPGPDVFLDLAVRPVDRLQMSLGSSVNTQFNRPRWVAEREIDAKPIFARAALINSNINFRLTLAITPRLSLTSFNQLLYSTARHYSFYQLDAPDLLVAIERDPWFGTVDRGLTSLTSNSILRWEYLPGSFLFVAYTHRTVLSETEGVVEYRPEKMFTNLGAGNARHEDVLFVKLAYLFGL
ncbi:hypothetical protein PPSIR1_19874 [Plesiocystis pacifica SIR-1]|uniref:DUF5916 domain-containing protein n=1 Tax=Plesiocystis pacifica SIR-1 TaxID=391625 RepID=A6GDS7_9BACT|nr:DUF5916 domain-containing protein [Plesiocystis pacifica]EDM75966.1 hypothetical protein PPSIR1_19874 [Plesiocystis pacifica SIR-1]